MWLSQSIQTGRPFTNFGDELSKYALEYAFRTKIKWGSPRRSEIIGIGSVIDFYLQAGGRGATIWGSGVRDPKWFEKNPDSKNRLGPVVAVRGPLTASVLNQSQSVALGDPGVLSAVLFADSRARSRHKRGIVYLPHFGMWATREGRVRIAEARSMGLSILSPTSHPKLTLQVISDADVLLTSSLHGMIVGHTSKTPVIPIAHAKTSRELTFKYEDYYSSMGLKYEPYEMSRFGGELTVSGLIDSLTESVEAIQGRAHGLAEDITSVARSV
ncbi:polysaccharide pyruvyl transferase family protein [Rhodococcoides fascians]|uniref:polysaccharide pyruvyl transferase family protein n=1 Tax=Rhodococcoides fascians TaxID=1828 RepID=UPI0014830F31|nr:MULTISPECIES: polysaccharide pyruvyl transferase family protein [Rhodococcus]